MNQKIKTVKNKICVICKRKEQKEWVEVSPGHKKLVYFCCEELKVKDSGNIILHRFRDPVAFGYDKKTGRLLAIDKKGRTFDPSDTRYDLGGRQPERYLRRKNILYETMSNMVKGVKLYG